jgi:hypothetical protein
VHGYDSIHLFDAVFYKTPLIPGATWDQAAQYNARGVYSLLSRHVPDWSYAADRVQLTPFAWVDSGTSAFEAARPPADVAEQLAAFRRWGTGRTFGDYAYTGVHKFDYGPYESAFKAATKPGAVDTQPPSLTVAKGGLSGTATDDMAVRVVRWRDRAGHEGTARIEPDSTSGDGAAVRWQIAAKPAGKTIWVRVEDLKGLARTERVRIVR